MADNKRVPRVLNRKAKYFGKLDVLKLFPLTLSGASLTEILRSAFLCKWTDSVGNDFPGTNCLWSRQLVENYCFWMMESAQRWCCRQEISKWVLRLLEPYGHWSLRENLTWAHSILELQVLHPGYGVWQQRSSGRLSRKPFEVLKAVLTVHTGGTVGGA